jgi:hypothetical protein
LPLFVGGAMWVLGLRGSLSAVGCDFSFTPIEAGARGSYSPPSGIACGDAVCEAGTVCCLLQDEGPTCAAAGVDNLAPSAVIDAGTCYGPYLGCDGPEDCSGATCCPKGFLFGQDYTACAVATSEDWFPCGFNAPVCHADSDCPPDSRCVLDDGGGSNGDSLAGYVSHCSP